MFEHAILVGEGDIDMLGHASNIAFVRWIQEAAIAHSAARGLDVEAYMRLGACFVVRRHEVDYLRPVLRGEALHMRTWIDSAAAAKCERVTEFRRATATALDAEPSPIGARPSPGSPSKAVPPVATARTTWGFVEATTGRPTRIPDEIRMAFGFPPRRGLPPLAAAGE